MKTVRVFGPGKVAPKKEYKCWETLERNTNRHITKCTAKKVYAVHTTNNAFRVSTCTRHVARKECGTNGRVLTTSQQTRQRPQKDVCQRRMLKHDYKNRAAHKRARKRPSLTGSRGGHIKMVKKHCGMLNCCFATGESTVVSLAWHHNTCCSPERKCVPLRVNDVS